MTRSLGPDSILNMINYEWDVEDTNIYGDVIDHNHRDALSDYHPSDFDLMEEEDARSCSLVLVRDDDNGRSWAYVEDGKLPTHFSDAYGNDIAKVPQRFHQELKNSKEIRKKLDSYIF